MLNGGVIIGKKEIEESLSEAIVREDRKEGRHKENEYHVSELVYCPRKAYIGRKFGIRGKLIGKMLSGTLFHKHFPDVVECANEIGLEKKDKEYFYGPKYEVPLYKEMTYEQEGKDTKIKIVGTCDMMEEGGITELKYSASRFDRDMPEHWIRQANAYAHMAGKAKFRIVQVHSKTLEARVKVMPIDAGLFLEAARKADDLHHAIENGNFPTGPEYSWECRYCGKKVKEKCRELEKEYD